MDKATPYCKKPHKGDWMRFTYEIGDMVKVRVNFKDWKIGEVGKIVKIEENSGYGMQILYLLDNTNHSWSCFSSYQIEPCFECMLETA